jgi:MFS family permease
MSFRFRVGIPKLFNFDNMFRALKYRNFRLFVSGQSLSLIGTWIQQIAMTWLIYRMTNSAFMLGVIGFSSQIPMFLLSPIAGVLADRWSRHKVLLVIQTAALIQALILSLIVFTGYVQIWHLIFLSVVLGAINAFDMPVRQSFMFDMLENNKKDLANAIAINSSMVNSTRLIGPAVAGILIAALGEGWCFALNSLSYVAVIISLLRMKNIPQHKNSKSANVLAEMKEGFNYTFGFKPIKYLLMLLALVSLMSTPLMLLAPVFAKEIFHGGASMYGFLMSAFGIGAMFGTVYLLNRRSVVGLWKLIAGAVFVLSLSMIAFSFSRIFWLSIIIIAISGLGMLFQIVSTNTMLQTISDENKRGRVLSFYSMAFIGMAPFGSLLFGSLTGIIGAQNTLILGGVFCLAGAALFTRKLPVIRPIVRPIYKRLGIMPEIVTTANSVHDLSVDEDSFK